MPKLTPRYVGSLPELEADAARLRGDIAMAEGDFHARWGDRSSVTVIDGENSVRELRDRLKVVETRIAKLQICRF